jgi:hypothetical protein
MRDHPLVGYWDGDPECEYAQSAHGAAGLEFHEDGRLLCLIPQAAARPEFDNLLSFTYYIDDAVIVATSHRTGRTTRTPFALADTGRLSIRFSCGMTSWARASEPRTLPRRDATHDGVITDDMMFYTPEGGFIGTGKDVKRKLEERDEQICATLGITREKLAIDRALWTLWRESKGPFESLPLDLLRELLEKGAEVNGRGNQGETLLLCLAGVGHTEAAALLLDHGADVNDVDDYGETALHLAVRGKYEDTIRLLLARGADPEARQYYFLDENSPGQTPLEIARASGNAVIERLLADAVDRRARVKPRTP